MSARLRVVIGSMAAEPHWCGFQALGLRGIQPGAVWAILVSWPLLHLGATTAGLGSNGGRPNSWRSGIPPPGMHMLMSRRGCTELMGCASSRVVSAEQICLAYLGCYLFLPIINLRTLLHNPNSALHLHILDYLLVALEVRRTCGGLAWHMHKKTSDEVM